MELQERPGATGLGMSDAMLPSWPRTSFATSSRPITCCAHNDLRKPSLWVTLTMKEKLAMATLPKMIQVFQPLDGRDIPTLTQHGRVLREAGLIPAGKRGVGAPHMTAKHAAILLLGIFGSATPKDGPVAADRMGDLKHHFTDGPMADTFERFTGRQRLGDTLATLIERAPEFLHYFVKIIEQDRAWTDEQLVAIRDLTARGASLIDTKISIGAAGANIKATWGTVILFDAIYMVDSDRFMSGEYNDLLNAERKLTISFTFRTIATLHEAVTGDVIDLTGARD